MVCAPPPCRPLQPSLHLGRRVSTREQSTPWDPIPPGGSPGVKAAPPPTTLITPPRRWAAPDLRELWAYRELLYFLVWRDVKVRYKQTGLGVAWAVLQPLLTMLVFSLFFGRLARMPSDGVPYPVFSLAALVPWTFFSYGLTQSANSLVIDQHLVRKVYFPRMAIPVATVLSGVVDFALAFVILLGLMLYYGMAPTLQTLWVVPLLLLALVTSLGAGLWLAALNVQYRDVRYTVPFLAQLWLFATPVAYPSSLLREPWRTLDGINPMAGVVEGFRWALLGTDTAPGPIIAVSSLTALLLISGGIFYFRRMEDTFADVI
jgi:lipopolysaccharide transport system permease protein